MAQHEVQPARVAGSSLLEAALDRPCRACPCRACFSSRRNSEHIIGDSVSDTKADTAIVIVTVIANSRNSRPMMPPISSSGMNTATSEMLMDMMVKPISLEPLSAASQRRHARLDVPVDVLQHHDRIVDDEADRDRERHQRKIVEAVAEDVHERRTCRTAPAAP